MSHNAVVDLALLGVSVLALVVASIASRKSRVTLLELLKGPWYQRPPSSEKPATALESSKTQVVLTTIMVDAVLRTIGQASNYYIVLTQAQPFVRIPQLDVVSGGAIILEREPGVGQAVPLLKQAPVSG